MHDLVESAHALRESLRAQAPAIERARRVPASVAADLAAQGFFKMLVPKSYGGGEVHPGVFVAALEALARGDAASAWTVMTGSTTGLLAAYLPESGARALFEREDAVPAGVFAPMGKATAVDGGYRVTGRWAWTSGVENSTVRLGGALVRAGGDGPPELRSFFFEPDQTKILDTWDVSGLRGTGSHDMVVEDAFVPADRSAFVFDGPRLAQPLYRFSMFGLLALGVSAVGLGIARAALDDFAELARAKKVGRRALCETETAQLRFAESEAELAAARALVFSTLDAAWAADEVNSSMKAKLRIAATHSARVAAKVVDTVYHLGGGASVHATNPLQRAFRDVHTMTQHIMVNEMSFRPAGRILLGLETDTQQL